MNNIYPCFRMVLHLSWTEIRIRYARSVIGPFWLVLTTAISIMGLGYIWSILFDMDKETFIPALTVGLVIWQFIAACISEAPSCFATYGSLIRNYSHPIWIYPTALVIKNFIIFCHNLLIVVVVLTLFPQGLGWQTLLFLPSILMVVTLLTYLVLILAFIGARYKDFGAAVIALMSIAFFLSPVIFKPDQLGVKEYLMWFNPFTYFITIIRDPITGQASAPFVYFVMIIFLCVSSVVAHKAMNKYKSQVSFWI